MLKIFSFYCNMKQSTDIQYSMWFVKSLVENCVIQMKKPLKWFFKFSLNYLVEILAAKFPTTEYSAGLMSNEFEALCNGLFDFAQICAEKSPTFAPWLRYIQMVQALRTSTSSVHQSNTGKRLGSSSISCEINVAFVFFCWQSSLCQIWNCLLAWNVVFRDNPSRWVSYVFIWFIHYRSSNFV